MAWYKKLAGRFAEALQRVAKEEQQERQEERLQVQEAAHEKKATNYMDVFQGKFGAEGEFITALEKLRVKKYTTTRVTANVKDAWTEIQNRKKALIGKYEQTTLRVRNLLTRLTSFGAGQISPQFNQQLDLWKQEQAKLLEVMEQEVQVQIAQNSGEMAKWQTANASLTEQTRIARDYFRFLNDQRRTIRIIIGELAKQIQLEVDEKKRAQYGHLFDIAELQRQRKIA